MATGGAHENGLSVRCALLAQRQGPELTAKALGRVEDRPLLGWSLRILPFISSPRWAAATPRASSLGDVLRRRTGAGNAGGEAQIWEERFDGVPLEFLSVCEGGG